MMQIFPEEFENDVDTKNDFTPCYVERTHFNTIFHNGVVDKCSNIDPSECKGYLNDDGKIIWNRENNFEMNEICTKCKYLPICMGGCSKMKDFFNVSNSFACQYSPQEHNNTILNYCKSILYSK